MLVRKRHVDVAFIMGTPDIPDCNVARLWSERLFVVLPEGHLPLPRKKSSGKIFARSISSFGDLPEPDLCRRITRRLTHRDYHPSVQKLDVGRETLMQLVALGLGVSLTGEVAVATRFAEVEFRPITGGDDVLQFSAVWSLENDNPALRRFLSLARGLAKNRKRLGIM